MPYSVPTVFPMLGPYLRVQFYFDLGNMYMTIIIRALLPTSGGLLMFVGHSYDYMHSTHKGHPKPHFQVASSSLIKLESILL